MAEVLLFHHVHGLTDGIRTFADELRAAGHVVHAPDLFDGRTFAELDDGMAYAREVGFDTVVERGRLAAEELPSELVYGGFSLGAVPAQMLAQTQPGARGVLLFHAAIPLEEFGGAWPEGVPLQIHVMEDDDMGDVDIARQLAEEIEGAELFLYPGDRHLFSDSSLAAYDAGAAALVTQRVLGFLAAVDRAGGAG
jgi:dienelactone hydrolase